MKEKLFTYSPPGEFGVFHVNFKNLGAPILGLKVMTNEGLPSGVMLVATEKGYWAVTVGEDGKPVFEKLDDVGCLLPSVKVKHV